MGPAGDGQSQALPNLKGKRPTDPVSIPVIKTLFWILNVGWTGCRTKGKVPLWCFLGRGGCESPWHIRGLLGLLQGGSWSCFAPTPNPYPLLGWGGFSIPACVVGKVFKPHLWMKALRTCSLTTLLKSSNILLFLKESLQVEQAEEKLLWN